MSSKFNIWAHVTPVPQLLRSVVFGFFVAFIAGLFTAASLSANDKLLTTAQSSNTAPEIESLPWRADVVVGERLNLLVTPHDDDNTVPVLSAEKLPEGSYLTDNRDGSRSLLWKPAANQVGEHRIVFTAADSRNPALVTERILVIIVTASAP